jgi:hypothetical protein
MSVGSSSFTSAVSPGLGVTCFDSSAFIQETPLSSRARLA